MAWACEPVNFENLQPANSSEEYALHLAALEWSLADPIIITGKDDIKSQVHWQGRFEPYQHQVQNLVTFCRRLPVTLIADDVGLGKTISAGLILAELMERKRVNRAFVVCPAILGPQWVEELSAKFNIAAVFAKGRELKDYLNRSAVPVVVTTYDSARNRLSDIRSDQFEMLILDEAHKLRNLHGTPNPPQMAAQVKKALEDRVFKYVLMLTATPIQNRVWDLYSLIDLLTIAKGHRNPLGTPDQFRNAFIEDTAGRRLNRHRGEEFRAILRQYLVRTRREDAQLLFPKRLVETRKLRGSVAEQRMMEIVSQHIGALGVFAQISLSQAMMSSPQALAMQIENMVANGTLPNSVAVDARAVANSNVATAKLQGLLSLVRELRQQRPHNWRMVVFTLRKETQDAIGRALSGEGIAVAYIRGGAGQANQATMEAFRANPARANVIVSTDAGAEGVNLQAGNVLVNYDLPWNPMVMEQRIGRIQRLASIHQSVIVVNLVIAGSVEERVVGRLMEKLQAVAETIGDIETILESTGQDDETGESFEEMIRKLVVNSLKGQNVEEATRMREQSIQTAKEMMQQERGNIDQVFGASSIDKEQGPKPPKLQPVKPSIAPESFVLRALKAEGATVHPRADDTLDVIKAGHPAERITFKPEVAEEMRTGFFMGNAPKLYLPGKPPFERLVQRWLDRSEHSVRDHSVNTEAYALIAAKSWTETVPGAAFKNAVLSGTRPQLVGEIVCRIKAANGVDSLEKLIRIEAKRPEHGTFEAVPVQDAPILNSELSPDSGFSKLSHFTESAIQLDKDVDAFCRFYEERRLEELGKSGADQRKRHKVEADLTPKVFGEIVGMTGLNYDVATTSVEFYLDGPHIYSSDIELVPILRKVLKEPIRRECRLTNRQLPECCLAACCISGELCTAHLLTVSEISGRRAMPKYAARCEVSGQTVLSDEISESAITGKKAAIALFRESPISGRRGLDEDFAKCEITGDKVLRDELLTSEVSNRSFRRDQSARCSVTGKVGHLNEFSRCQETGEIILPQEAGHSEVSGRTVRKDLLVKSEKAPYRVALQKETTRCAATNKLLLLDELIESAVSGRMFDRDIAVASDVSGKFAMPAEVVRCEVSKAVVLPAETEISAVSKRRARRDLLKPSTISGRLGLVDELCMCEVTGTTVLVDELATSDESGRKFRSDQAVRSAESGRVAHVTESVTCAASGQPILKSEAGRSAVSGRTYSKRLLHASEKSPDRYGLVEETVACARTDRRLLLDEVARSAVSGECFDRDLLQPSQRSGDLALPEEMVICQETGHRLLPCELVQCSISGKRVDAMLLTRSDLSGAPALERLMEKCAVTGKLVLPSELRQCEVTGKRVVPGELDTCSITGKRVLRDQLVRSDVSGALLLPEHAVRSPVSKRVCAHQEAVICHWRQQRILPNEASTCRITGLTFSRELMNPANEFAHLRYLLDGKDSGTDASDIVRWLSKTANGAVANLHSARCIFSPDGAVRAICGESRSMLGLKVRYVGFLAIERGERQLLGRIAIGRRSREGWNTE